MRKLGLWILVMAFAFTLAGCCGCGWDPCGPCGDPCGDPCGAPAEAAPADAGGGGSCGEGGSGGGK